MKWFAFITALIAFSPASLLANVLVDAEGTWGTIVINETGDVVTEDYVCDGEPIRIEIDSSAKRLTSYRNVSEKTHADIIAHGENWLTLKYDGEERTMSNGEPQIWTLFMANADSFVWVRQDWIEDGRIANHTSPRHRCTPAMS
ncbi:hypothetical protein ACFFUB_14285 [Algimonas porphyrae]|uniref:Uncharacterized protein n=1 Tax=Algimonas porphyrae TaxID=1128113 RepID=A0ABQ5UYS6_9PROT|nr:hypothetical protein [Algimonas porphyrae]GLQ19589.1 hypothetical protein GCM10007854_05440 [Algimonas porphyrae]